MGEPRNYEEEWYASNRALHAAWKERDELRAALQQIRDTCPGRPAILARAALGESREVSIQPVAWCPNCIPHNGKHARSCISQPSSTPQTENTK